MSVDASASQADLDDNQRGSMIALDALLDVTIRDYTTPLVVPQEVRTVLVRLARNVCGSPQRAEQLVSESLDDDRPASDVLPHLRARWAEEDALFELRLDDIASGGSLHLAQQLDGRYRLIVADQATEGGATITLWLTAQEMAAFNAEVTTHHNRS